MIKGSWVFPSLALLVLTLSGCSLGSGTADFEDGAKRFLFDPSPPGDGGFALDSTQVRVHNRDGISTGLQQAFSAAVVDPHVATLVHSGAHFHLFGKPCEPYALDFQYGGCTNKENTQIKQAPNYAVSSMGLLTRVCDRTLGRAATGDTAVNYAASQIGVINPSVTPPTDTHIEAAYELLHPGHPLPSEVLPDLRHVVNEAALKGGSTLESWRFLFLTLCVSSSWLSP